MRSKTYRAKTMKEALTRVRRDLGGEAVILAAREVRRRRLFGLGARALVEVTATDRMPSEVAVEIAGASTMPAGARPPGSRPGRPVAGLAGSVRGAAQPPPRHGRDPQPAGPDRPPAAGAPRRAGPDLLAVDRGRRPGGPRPPAGAARRRVPRARPVRAGRVDPRGLVRGGRAMHPGRAADPVGRRRPPRGGPGGPDRGRQDHDRRQARGQFQAGPRRPRRAAHGGYLPDRGGRAAQDLRRDHRPAPGRGQRSRPR